MIWWSLCVAIWKASWSGPWRVIACARLALASCAKQLDIADYSWTSPSSHHPHLLSSCWEEFCSLLWRLVEQYYDFREHCWSNQPFLSFSVSGAIISFIVRCNRSRCLFLTEFLDSQLSPSHPFLLKTSPTDSVFATSSADHRYRAPSTSGSANKVIWSLHQATWVLGLRIWFLVHHCWWIADATLKSVKDSTSRLYLQTDREVKIACHAAAPCYVWPPPLTPRTWERAALCP